MKERILSLLLALSLLCAMLPQIALPTRAEAAYSGTCGENLTWRFDPDTGTLTIEGSGRMYDFDYVQYVQPWKTVVESINRIILPTGLSEIGMYAFYGCTNLTEITLPDGLTFIGCGAFEGCTGLKTITFPDGLTQIDDSAFSDCTGLKEITLPDGLTRIGYEAFSRCFSLKELSVPQGVTSVSDDAFLDCTFSDIYYGGDEDQWEVLSVDVFTERIHYDTPNPENHWSIHDQPPTCTEAGIREKNCMCGYSIVLEALPALGHSFVNGVCTICGQLESVSDDLSGTCGENLTWRFDPDTDTLTIKGSGKMYDFDTTSQPWYEHMDSIKKIVFPTGLTSVGDHAFWRCTELTSITLPDELLEIGENAFGFCTGLASVTLPEGLKSTGSSVFTHCTALTSVNLPAGLTTIEGYAFQGCTGLTSITLPDSLSSIGDFAFEECTALRSITLPVGLTTIDSTAFYDCTGLTSFCVAEGNTVFSVDSCGVLFDKAKTKLLHFPCGRTGSYMIPESVTSIGFNAFQGCTGLTSVTFPDGLTSIGAWAFVDCTGLTSVVIPKSVTEIDDIAFGYRWDKEMVCEYLITNFTIYGYKGTAAQTYAQENGIKFVPLDPGSGFSDVKPKHYYYNAMLWALERGITSGTSRVTFSPNDTCTRGQVMTFLYAAKGKPEADWSNNPFVDVKKRKYYFKPVLWAVQNGVTNGMDATHFQPNGSCTRAQVVTFLWALSGKPNPKAGSNPFKDVKKSNWYYKAVLWANQNGITSGVDATHFGPNQTCTRGQVVTFLYKLLGDK